jgi:hypothetical protein
LSDRRETLFVVEDPVKAIQAIWMAMAVCGASVVSAHAERFSCEGGGNMAVTDRGGGTFNIAFDPKFEGKPEPGECIVPEPADGEAPQIVMFLPAIKKSTLVGEAAEDGGSFVLQIQINPNNQAIVTAVISVKIKKAMPDDGNGGSGNGAENDDGHCPAANATVSIPEDNLDKLNVRSRPNGKVVGTVPEGHSVSVVGHCDGDPVDHGWCKIDDPMAGCVKRKYLEFGGGKNAG